MDETFEDVTVGQSRSFGSYEVTTEEIVEFAEQYDPQPFHTDPEAAAESMFGGLVASGWHTAAMTMRLIVDNYLSESGAMGAVGVDELRWRSPVRPGDTLSVESEIVDKDGWDDWRGVVHSETEVVATDDEGDERTVMTMVALVLYPREGALS